MLRILGWAILACGLYVFYLLIAGQITAARSGVPYWVAEQVPDRMDNLRYGMTRPQVMAALGLAGRGVGPAIDGGPTNALHEGFGIQPGMGVTLTFDCTRLPCRYVDGDVQDDGTLRWQAALALGLTIFGGFVAWLGSKLARKTRDLAAPPAGAEAEPPDA